MRAWEIEWIDTSGGEYQSECPVCGAHGPDWRDWVKDENRKPPEPHRPDCRLAAVLGGKA